MYKVVLFSKDRIFELVKIEAGWHLTEKIKESQGVYRVTRKMEFSSYGEANYFLMQTYPELIPGRYEPCPTT